MNDHVAELRILAISGSLRAASHNTAVVEAARKYAPAGIAVSVYTGLPDIPHYNQDRDLDGQRPLGPVAELRRVIAGSHGLLIATPELHHSIPGVLKNALDWASQPARRSVLIGKPVAVTGASPTRSGAVRAQRHLREVLLCIGARVVDAPELAVCRSHTRLDPAGHLTDEPTIERLRDLLRSLAATCRPAASVVSSPVEPPSVAVPR
jgi:chromate reductase, NAD(P)H dehydrogenase (quinone)